MAAKSLFFPLALLVFLSSAYAERRPYATNAVAVVNMSVVSLKSEKKTSAPPSREELIQTAKSMYSEAITNSSYYDNSEEIEKFSTFVKTNKLESALKKEMDQVPSMLSRSKYDVEWSKFSYFARTAGVGLLDQEEFLLIKNKLMYLQKIRAQRSKKPEVAKEELKVITSFENQYNSQRSGRIEKSRALCQEEVDWGHLFSARKGQTDTGWCYAFAYADFLEATHKQNVSAADIVLRYRDHRIKEEKETYERKASLYNLKPLDEKAFANIDYIYKGGDFDRIFRKQSSMSVCSEDDLRSEAKDHKGQPVAMGYVIEWLNEIGRDYTKGDLSRADLIKKLQAFDYQQIFPNAKLDDVLENLKPDEDLYLLLAQNTCHGRRIQLPNLTSNWVLQGYSFQYSLDKVQEKLIEDLNRGPVVISVNDAFLYKENIWGRGLRSNHVIVVTGKRWNEQTQHCEFKIRNSQSTYADQEERVWYSDTELLRNTVELYITPLLPVNK